MANNGWTQWEKHVLAELKRLNDNMERTETKNDDDHRELFSSIATLRVKAGVWGAMAGAIPGIGVLIFFLVRYFSGS